MNKDRKIGRRTVARLVAIQTLFQYHFYDNKIALENILNDTIEFYIKEEYGDKSDYEKIIDLDLTKTLIYGVDKNIEKIDKLIKDKLKAGNTINGLQGVVKEILRLATFELQNMRDISAKIIINEYVDLTAYFGEKSHIALANGILDNIAKEISNHRT